MANASAEPVLIIGAGIGGLGAALALAQHGIPVRVFEQAASAEPVGAGIGLWPGALASMRLIGVAEWFWDLPVCPFVYAETAAPDGRTLTGFDVSGITGGAGYVVRRSDLHRALLEPLGSDVVHFGRQLVHVQQDARGVRVAFADGTRASGRALIGADGLRSVVRAAILGVQAPRYSGETCYRGLADMAVLDTGILREVQGAGLRGAVHPLDDEHVYWWATRRAPAGLMETPAEMRSILTRLFGGWQGGLPEAIAATPDGTILRNDLFDRPAAKVWSRGSITLLGDAAHPTTPNLGLGGCMALEDALTVGHFLAQTPDEAPTAFAAYEAARHKRTAAVVRMSAAFGRLGSLSHPWAIRGRELAHRLTPTPLSARAFSSAVGFDPRPYLL